MIAQKAIEFIIAQEVTSRAYFMRHYQQPEWPGGASGITIAIGYDLGYASPKKIIDDWGSLVPAEMLTVMLRCSGVKGEEAKALLPEVKSKITIPWDPAMKVFISRDIPQWTLAVQKALPNCDKISSLCLGMHVATAYNRGAGGYSSNAPRFVEMRHIHEDMESQDFKNIGQEFLMMRRLWPTLKGLQTRYTQTADLWNEGLGLPAGPPPVITHDPEVPLNAGPARTKPPATTTLQHGTTGAVIGGGVVVAHQAAQHGVPASLVAAIVVFGLALAAGLWVAWYRNRNPK